MVRIDRRHLSTTTGRGRRRSRHLPSLLPFQEEEKGHCLPVTTLQKGAPPPRRGPPLSYRRFTAPLIVTAGLVGETVRTAG